MADSLRDRIHEANIAVHRFEAQYYELLHPEVYGGEEQNRIRSMLNMASQLVAGNQKRALDFGAGTGNLTGKLLGMGYQVTAVDISAEMCAILEKKYSSFLEAENLVVINASVEDVGFGSEEFDLVACYSVLHHLPDYEGAIKRFSGFLRKGGVMYIDHEASPFYWKSESTLVADWVKLLYFHSNPVLNALYFAMMGVNVPSLDYTLSDYWHKKEHPLDHDAVKHVFEGEDFELFTRTDYHLRGTWIPNPLFYAFRYYCNPEMSCWIAKK